MVEVSARVFVEMDAAQSSQFKNFTRHFENEGVMLSVDFTLEQALNPERWDEAIVKQLIVTHKKRAWALFYFFSMFFNRCFFTW